MNITEYNKIIIEKISENYSLAEKAKAVGKDFSTAVEITKAEDIAARVEQLVGPIGVAKRIREIMKEKNRSETAFRIMDEIMEGRFGKFERQEELAEQCVRTAITLLTEGIVVAGTEGISKVEINKNPDGTRYLSIFFASPIRSAGGSAGAYAAMLADYVRKKLGLQEYRPTDKEIDRYIEEIELYHTQQARLQYYPKEDEIIHIMKNCPVCVDGDPSSLVEVAVNKNIERIPTNNLRGGMCLVMAESIAQKPPKMLTFSKKHNLGWDWLEGLIKVVKTSGGIEIKPLDNYLGDIVGGRPIFGYPSTPGGFRLRYGRCRNTGLNARAIHPAAMEVLDEFPVIGTQLKVERPKKGCVVAPCDTIEPPVVRLKNGDVLAVDSVEKAIKLKEEVQEILFLGDMLVNYGDFLNANHPLIPAGICEEWWGLIVRQKANAVIDPNNVSPELAIELSEKYKVPLHPKYTYFYGDLTKEELISMINWLKTAELENIEGFEKPVKRFILDVSEEKRMLEKICLPHKVRDNRIIIEKPEVLIKTLGLEKTVNLETLANECENSLEMINKLAEFPVYNKAPTYIGARMGRPEKAKERKMSPPVHGLTPVGNFGGKTRSVEKAAGKEKIPLDIIHLYCPKCKKTLFKYKCECGERAVTLKTCNTCSYTTDKKIQKCEKCGGKMLPHHKGIIDLGKELKEAKEKFGIREELNIKGVIGVFNPKKCFEPLEKTVLRAKHNVFVFKDGTIRFDATNMPITHVKPAEIQTSVEKMRELGYTEDHTGKKLTDTEQIVEIMPQDILLNDRAAEYFTRVANFVDELLEKYYGLPKFYNIQKKEDLIGQMFMAMAPHISAGTAARAIGFTKARVGYAHPYMHCATRRDCDGDENGIMLLMDALLNFSKEYISGKAGSTEDVPQILSLKIEAHEVDDQAHDIEMTYSYPIEFYEAAQKIVNANEVKIPIVKNFLGTEKAYAGFGFTHDTSRIDEGPTISQYTQLKTMKEKVEKELELAEKIRAVDEKDVAARILNYHFLRDIYGNLRSFGQQTFRCVDCNEKYRRVPLVGKCTKCGGKIVLTVHKGGIEKYLNLSKQMAEKYGLGDYLKQRLKLIEKDLEVIFESEKSKQYSLSQFM